MPGRDFSWQSPRAMQSSQAAGTAGPAWCPGRFCPLLHGKDPSAIGDLPKEVSGLWLLLHGAGAGQVMEGGQGPPEVVLCGVGLL